MEICYLCGRDLDGTVERSDDHIPPKSLFDSGTEQITVPCCRKCNEEYSVLDELFKTKLSFTSVEVPEEVLAKSIRAISPKEGADERDFKARLSRFQRLGVEELNIDGQRRLKINFDTDPLNKWLSRIIKGLYFNRLNERMPEELIFTTTPPNTNDPVLPKALTDLFTDKRSQCFWWTILSEELQDALLPDTQTWMFVFYKTVFMTTNVTWKNE